MKIVIKLTITSLIALFASCASDPHARTASVDDLVSRIEKLIHKRGKSQKATSLSTDPFGTSYSSATPTAANAEAKNLAGIWRSESSDSVLLITEDHDLIIMTVSDMGKLKADDDGELHIERDSQVQHLTEHFFIDAKNNRIIRHEYDTSEHYIRQ